ncbi:DUF4041 domain-containing protein [Chryseolinea sp. T2]|uniref:DUF4041 domain-containing protein n=1 Tax=Chryseolinea sp. T2 TaxID=3129255 RepID=UPI00307854A8
MEKTKVQVEQTKVLLEQKEALLKQALLKVARYEHEFKDVLDKERLLEGRKRQVVETESQLRELIKKYKDGLVVHKSLEAEIELYKDTLEIGSFGLYAPHFSFDTSEKFKEEILANRAKQSALIKNDQAAICETEWPVGGSKAEGKKMTNQYKKLMLFAFNGECDALIAKVAWNNATKFKDRMCKSFESINKLGGISKVLISHTLLNLKLDELMLTHEYEKKLEEEREEQRRIREQMRDEEKAQRELERAQKDAEDEERRSMRALAKATEELKKANDSQAMILNEQIKQLQQQLDEANQKKERAIAQAQLTKVGHIYIISNVGSFGDDIYKIGMTRRLDPLDRVKELGDASVPFEFDVHAIIYSDNAPQLESELHSKFSDRRMNRVNHKKEFFKISLDEIQTFVNQHSNSQIQFTKVAEAREYRETVSMIRELEALLSQPTAQSKFPVSLE